MIRFPRVDTAKTDDILSSLIKNNKIELGQRYKIGENFVTCVDISDNKYIFSFDKIFIQTYYNNISNILQRLWCTGKVNGIEILPVDMIKNIDFVFVPNEFQVFGGNKNIHQFEWYKLNGDFSRIKGWCREDDKRHKGEICAWWLSDFHPNDASDCREVDWRGTSGRTFSVNSEGVAIFFQMTRKEN